MSTEAFPGAVTVTAPVQGGAYAYTFDQAGEAELYVTFDEADGTVTVLALNTDYTVSPTGQSYGGGTLTLLATPPAGATLSIDRWTRPLQEGAFKPVEKVFERALDRIVQVAQDISRRASFSVSQTSTAISLAPMLGPSLTFDAATQALAGVMSAQDKTKLDGLANTLVSVDPAHFASRAQIAATIVDEGVGFARTAGYYTAGDGGGALYRRVGAEPSHVAKVQSADGGWWELVPDGRVRALQAGMVADSTSATPGTDNATALQSLIDWGYPIRIDEPPAGFAFGVSQVQLKRWTNIRGPGMYRLAIVGTTSDDTLVAGYSGVLYREIQIADLYVENAQGGSAVELFYSPDFSAIRCYFRSVGASARAGLRLKNSERSSCFHVRCGGNPALHLCRDSNYFTGGGMVLSGGSLGRALDISGSNAISMDAAIETSKYGIRIGDNTGVNAWQDFVVDDTAGFVVGETVTGGTSGATATVERILSTTRMAVTVTAGTFQPDDGVSPGPETIAGGTSSTIATLSGVTDPYGGWCDSIHFLRLYEEAVEQEVLKAGHAYAVNGLLVDVWRLNNAALTTGTSFIAGSDAITLGRVKNFRAGAGRLVGFGTETAITLLAGIVTSGSAPGFLETSDIDLTMLENFATDLDTSALSTADAATVAAANRIRRDDYGSGPGTPWHWTSGTLVANATVGTIQISPTLTMGGRALSVELIEGDGGSLSGARIRVGNSTGSVGEIVDTTFGAVNHTYFAFPLVLDLVRPSDHLVFRVDAGAGVGSFRIRVRAVLDV